MSYFKVLGFEKEPFSTSPDPNFFYLSREHEAVLSNLLIELRLRRGMSVVLGNVGTGKTTLSRKLIQELREREDFIFHIILNPSFENERLFLSSLIKNFEINATIASDASILDLRDTFERFLFQKGVAEAKTVVLVIDEAQKLNEGSLELLRIFLNYETNEFKLLQLILLGQLEFYSAIMNIPNFFDRISFKFTLNDKWSSNPAAFKDINVGDGVFSVCYNYPDETGKGSLTLWGLVDEERKINVNSAGAEVLSRLIQLILGLDETEAKAMAAAIVDWRDSDSALSETGEGAEDTYYFGLSLPYEAKDSAFEVLEELLLVKDMTSAAFERLGPYLTVFGNGRVNINTASGTVLMALGLDNPLAEKVLAFRRGRDETEATADDNVFESTDEIVPKLSEFYRLTANEIAQLSSVASSSLAVGSAYFLVRCEASLANRKNKRIVNSVINKSGAILSWSES